MIAATGGSVIAQTWPVVTALAPSKAWSDTPDYLGLHPIYEAVAQIGLGGKND